MKVILLKDVPGVGQRYEICKISAGYGRNRLLPGGEAVLATEGNIRKVEALKREHAQVIEKNEAAIGKALVSLEGVVLSLRLPANDEGHLFAGVHRDEISRALKETHGIGIPPELITLEKPLKALGDYEVPIQLKAHKVILKVVIEPQPS